MTTSKTLRKPWTFPPRVPRQLVTALALGGLVLWTAAPRFRGAPVRPRWSAPRAQDYQAVPPLLLPTPGPDDAIIHYAPAGIDDRFVVAAPAGIDDRMLVAPGELGRRGTTPNALPPIPPGGTSPW